MNLLQKGTFYFLVVVLWFTGCSFNHDRSVENIIKDFNLAYQGDSLNQALFVNIDHTEYGGLKIVEAPVFALGWNGDFIIAFRNSSTNDSVVDTTFYIIDIRDYSVRFWGPRGNVYVQENPTEFARMKNELGVPDLPMVSTGRIN